MRQGISAIAGNKSEGHALSRQGRSELLDGLTGKVHVDERCIELRRANEIPRPIDSACRTDDLAADFVEGRFNIHRDERRVFDHEYAPAFEWEAAGMRVHLSDIPSL